MKITIGDFEFDGSIGLRGWTFFIRIPHVCESYTTTCNRGFAYDQWSDGEGNRTMQFGKLYLTVDSWKSITKLRQAWQSKHDALHQGLATA